MNLARPSISDRMHTLDIPLFDVPVAGACQTTKHPISTTPNGVDGMAAFESRHLGAG